MLLSVDIVCAWHGVIIRLWAAWSSRLNYDLFFCSFSLSLAGSICLRFGFAYLTAIWAYYTVAHGEKRLKSSVARLLKLTTYWMPLCIPNIDHCTRAFFATFSSASEWNKTSSRRYEIHWLVIAIHSLSHTLSFHLLLYAVRLLFFISCSFGTQFGSILLQCRSRCLPSKRLKRENARNSTRTLQEKH